MSRSTHRVAAETSSSSNELDAACGPIGILMNCAIEGCSRTPSVPAECVTSLIIEGDTAHLAATPRRPRDCKEEACATRDHTRTIQDVRNTNVVAAMVSQAVTIRV